MQRLTKLRQDVRAAGGLEGHGVYVDQGAKPALAAQMIAAALGGGIDAPWVTGREEAYEWWRRLLAGQA